MKTLINLLGVMILLTVVGQVQGHEHNTYPEASPTEEVCQPTPSLALTPTLVNVSLPVELVTSTPELTSTPTPTAGASANLTSSSTVVVQSIPESAPSTGRAK